MVIFLAALQAIPRELYEAASIDGANAWHQFRRVTLPLLRPTMVFVLVMLVIGGFNVFISVQLRFFRLWLWGCSLLPTGRPHLYCQFTAVEIFTSTDGDVLEVAG